jgi:hypothetical protein
VLQRFFAQFPTQGNRENISENREFLSRNREFLSNVSGFLTVLSQRRGNRVAMSASPPKADIHRHDGNVRFMPTTEVAASRAQIENRPTAASYFNLMIVIRQRSTLTLTSGLALCPNRWLPSKAALRLRGRGSLPHRGKNLAAKKLDAG